MTIYPILLYFFDMMNLDKLKENKKKELLDIFEKLYKNSSYKTLNEKEKIDFIVEEGFDDLELFDSSNSSKLDIKEFYKIIANFEKKKEKKKKKEKNYIITPNAFFKKINFSKENYQSNTNIPGYTIHNGLTDVKIEQKYEESDSNYRKRLKSKLNTFYNEFNFLITRILTDNNFILTPIDEIRELVEKIKESNLEKNEKFELICGIDMVLCYNKSIFEKDCIEKPWSRNWNSTKDKNTKCIKNSIIKTRSYVQSNMQQPQITQIYQVNTIHYAVNHNFNDRCKDKIFNDKLNFEDIKNEILAFFIYKKEIYCFASKGEIYKIKGNLFKIFKSDFFLKDKIFIKNSEMLVGFTEKFSNFLITNEICTPLSVKISQMQKILVNNRIQIQNCSEITEYEIDLTEFDKMFDEVIKEFIDKIDEEYFERNFNNFINEINSIVFEKSTKKLDDLEIKYFDMKYRFTMPETPIKPTHNLDLFAELISINIKSHMRYHNALLERENYISKENLKENQEKYEAIKKEITPDLIGMIKEWLNKTAVLE